MDRAEELRQQIQARAEQARQIAEAAENDGGWTAESRGEVAALLEEVKGLKARLDDEQGGGELRRALDELAAEIGTPPAPPAGSNGHRPLGAAGQSLGAAFVNSEQYKALVRQFPSGRIPERARVSMDPVNLESFFKQGDVGLISITGTEGAQGLVPPDYQGLVDLLGRPELHMRDLLSRRTTTSDLIEYVRQLTRYPAADWVPEATDLDPAEFPSGETGVKPMSSFDFEIVTAPVDTIAEWTPITKRAVMDAAQLRGLIDQELRGNIADAEERTLLYGGAAMGSGAGVIEGLDETDGVQVQDFDTDLFVTTRKARSKVRFFGFATPTAYLMNIDDDEAIDLERDNQGRFYGAGPFAMGPQTLWGLPRVASQYVRPGEAWVADWRRAVVWDRQQATISVSDSHADFFIRNLLAVLGEQREAFGVVRPSAFVKIETAE